MRKLAGNLLWIDCTGGLLAGLIMLAIHPVIASWHNLLPAVIAGIGLVNLIYGSFSLLIATRKKRLMIMVKTLAIANTVWTAICGVLLICFRDEISTSGILHLTAEGIYVGALGLAEWKYRDLLANG
ncbi:MAG: hypothetical protein AB7H86_06895 [Blastocatellales bacterium]